MFSIYMKTTLKFFLEEMQKQLASQKKNLKAHAETDMEVWHYQHWAVGTSAMGGEKLGKAAIRNVLEEENIF